MFPTPVCLQSGHNFLVLFVLLAPFGALPNSVCRSCSMISLLLLCVCIVVSIAYKSEEY